MFPLVPSRRLSPTFKMVEVELVSIAFCIVEMDFEITYESFLILDIAFRICRNRLASMGKLTEHGLIITKNSADVSLKEIGQCKTDFLFHFSLQLIP